jgi:RNA polymerase sigma factor (sigma-70 family)
MATRPQQRQGTDRRARILEQLLADHARVLRRQASRHCSRSADVEEALQDAYLAFLRWYRGEAGEQAIAYLMIAVKHSAWAISRRSYRRRELGLTAVPRGDGSTCDLTELLADCQALPCEQAEDRCRLEHRRRAIDTLKPDQRTALLLFALGYSYREIATLRGWTMTKVNRCIAEGRAALRRGQRAE